MQSNSRYKIDYAVDSTTRAASIRAIYEIRDPSGNVRTTPITYTTSGDISGAVAQMQSCPLYTDTICLLDTSGSNVTQFTRLISIDYQGNSKFVGDYTADLSGTYTPSGVVSLCDTNEDYVQTLCYVDQSGSTLTPFTRLVCIDKTNASINVVGDFTPDLSGTYTVTGTAQLASDVGTDPLGVLQYRQVVANGASWVKPSNFIQTVEMRADTVANSGNPPTITDHAGNVTSLRLGDIEDWSVITELGTQFLSGNLTLTTNAGDSVTVKWTEIEI